MDTVSKRVDFVRGQEQCTFVGLPFVIEELILNCGKTVCLYPELDEGADFDG